MTNKKAAMELSMGTIVIIVLSVTLLVLGMVFIRGLMCSGIQIGEKVDEGVKNELRTLFGTDDYGVTCMGEKGQEIKIGTGGRRQIVCYIKSDEQVKYSLIVNDFESLSGAPSSTLSKWIIDKNVQSVDVAPGSKGAEPVVMLLNVPRDAPTTSLKLNLEAKNLISGSTTSHIMYIDIVPIGAIRGAIC